MDEVTSRYRRVAGPWWAAVILAIGPALISSVAAYVQSTEAANERSSIVKDKAEAGYQVTRARMAEIQERLTGLEEELEGLRGENSELRKANKALSKRKGRADPAVKVANKPVAAETPAPIPPNLDVALQQVTTAANKTAEGKAAEGIKETR